MLFVLSMLFPQRLTEEWYNPLASVVHSVEAVKSSCGVCGGEGGFFITGKLCVLDNLIYSLQIHRLN